ncbi:MAG TPA: NAD(P)/FAD-dependent oxidoreductase [Thermoplasmata archaeon]|nr:NAD(P)/FAD-dependent oxidoreductase [Thermoplasmata archaeon]
MSRPLSDVDAIVVGGGHNGLVAAAYLAKAGLQVTVLERRSIVGGACVTEEIHPGFRVSTLAYTCGLFRPEIKEDLQLASFGLEEHAHDPSMFLPFPDRHYLLYRPDPEWNRQQVAQFSKADAAAWPRYEAFWEEFAELVEPTLLAPPVSVADLAALMRSPAAEEFLRRVMFMSIADLLEEYFESEEVKASLATSAVAGTMAGPRTPGTAFVLGHHALGEIGGLKGAWGWAKGGMGAISDAIARAAVHFGAKIRTGAEVARIEVRDHRATGVALLDGTTLRARVVLSNADPRRTFLGLVGEDRLPPEFARAVSRIRFESSSFKLNLALRELPDFTAIPGTIVQSHHRAIIDIAPSMDYLERAYDDARRGHPSRDPFLEFVIQSANDTSVAPRGMHTLTISTKFAPFRLASGSWDTEAEPFAERIIDVLEEYAPNIRRAIVARQWRSPLDMEREYGLTRGDVFHGAILPHQMFSFRPVPGWSQYRTPIRALYLCGAGAHPGGGVMGAAGHNAALAVLEDWPGLAAAAN